MTSGSGKAGPFSRASLISSKRFFFFYPWNPVKRSFPTLELHIGLCQFNKPRDSELTQPSRSQKIPHFSMVVGSVESYLLPP